MKFCLAIIIFISVVFFVWNIENEKNWEVIQSVVSPDEKMLAVLKRNENGGATVGVYCKLYFVDESNTSHEMMLVRTPNVILSWIGTNILEVTVDKNSKIHNFTNFAWNKKSSSEYYIYLHQE